MQYISPIRFFDYCQIPDNELGNSVILKKRVNAEFLLAENGLISVDNYSYNKQDILLEIEQPDFQNRVNFHRIIWGNKELLTLLEKEKIDFSLFNVFKRQHYSIEFTQFISPYLITPFSKILKNLLLLGNFKDATTWLNVQKWMIEEDLFEAFQSFRFYAENTFFFFRNISRDNFNNKIEEIDIWTNKSQDWSLFFNALPDFLIEYREDFSHGLTHLIVELQFPDIKRSYAISKMLVNLHVSPVQEALIKKNNEIIKKQFKEENKPVIFSGKYSRFSFFLIFVFFRLMYSLCNKNEERRPIYDSYKTFVPLPPQADSAFQKVIHAADSNGKVLRQTFPNKK